MSETSFHNLKTLNFWKVANHIQSVVSDVELPEDQIPWETCKEQCGLGFVDDQKWDTKDGCKNSIRSLDAKRNSYVIELLKINKATRDKVRHASPADYVAHGLGMYQKQHQYERGSHVAVKCKLFALPEDEIADSVSSYEEYAMKCEILGKADRLSEIDFEIYKY